MKLNERYVSYFNENKEDAKKRNIRINKMIERGGSLNIDKIARSYIEAALWSSTIMSDDYPDMEGDSFDEHFSYQDVEMSFLKKTYKDIKNFINKAQNSKYGNILEGIDEADIGHDFWLTRNGHGAGFWDRGYDKLVGESLTKIAEKFGSVYLYVTDNFTVDGD